MDSNKLMLCEEYRKDERGKPGNLIDGLSATFK
jgi:hypothetical protein